jgi:hypothetical protein
VPPSSPEDSSPYAEVRPGDINDQSPHLALEARCPPPPRPNSCRIAARRAYPRWLFGTIAFAFQARKTHARRAACQRPHLADSDGVQLLDTFSLRQTHLDEFCVQALYVREHEKLLDGSAIAHIALESGICLAPLLGSLAKQGDIEKIGFAGISTRGLRSANHSRDQVCLNRVGMDPVVEFGKCTVEIPRKGKASVLIFLEALEFLYEVELEFY